MDAPFGSTDFKVALREEQEHSVRLTLSSDKAPFVCPHCKDLLPEVDKFGTRNMTCVDLPAYGKRTVLLVNRQRYRCRKCTKTFMQMVDFVDEDHRLTKRAVEYIETNTLRRTHSELASELGVDVKTVWNVFIQWAKRMDAEHKIIAPRWLGIDEIFAIGRPRCVLTNIEENTVLDMLADRNKPTVQRWISKLRPEPEVVAIDMWQPYRDAVQPLFPKATIVIDKFHVVRMANLGLDTFRKSLKEGMKPAERRQLKKDRFLLLRRYADLTAQNRLIFESWIGRFPLLKDAHRLKEDFYAIYDCQHRADAQKAYEQWLESVPKELLHHFNPLIRAVSNWHVEIFNYFDVQPRVTNAFTESLNNLISHIISDGRGYSFPVLRAKLLFTKRRELPLVRRSFDLPAAAHIDPGDLGADVSTLMEEYGLI